MNELALFAGAGGGILGGKLLGWNTIGAVEIEEYPRKVLLQRQQDGILPLFPIWDDITTFNGRPWKGCVDIVSGGFPCQDISAAGKGAGIEGERSGLWKEFKRVVYEIGPDLVYVENSPMLTSRGLGVILSDLAEMGYNARWCVLGADDAGAPHRRKRIWILAYSGSNGCRRSRNLCDNGKLSEANRQRKASIINQSSEVPKDMAYTNSNGCGIQRNITGSIKQKLPKKTGFSNKGSSLQGITYWDTDPADIPDPESPEQQGERRETRERRTESGCSSRGTVEPEMGRVAHGVAHRVDRLKAIGNGQVPAVAAIAFTILSEGLITC